MRNGGLEDMGFGLRSKSGFGGTNIWILIWVYLLILYDHHPSFITSGKYIHNLGSDPIYIISSVFRGNLYFWGYGNNTMNEYTSYIIEQLR
jgi:hypothetical protein